MDKYRIDKYPVEFYLDQYDQAKLWILPHMDPGTYTIENGKLLTAEEGHQSQSSYFLPGQREKGAMTIRYGIEDFDFDLYFPLKNGIVEKHLIALGREFLAVLPELDAKARKRKDEDDLEEHLAYVEIEEGSCELHYFSTTVNTEWEVEFVKRPDGWRRSWEA